MGAMTVDSNDEAFEGAKVEVVETKVVDPRAASAGVSVKS
jgi:hypothetical protein